MKIEKISENQIRCTLTPEDLADRHLKLSELAYGSEKAKMLFHDMMQQASYEFGFEAEDIPLMIEAIPVSPESIVLLVTKVEYPDELDTRFSKFSDAPEEYDDYTEEEEELFAESADDILGMFREIAKQQADMKEAEKPKDFVPLKDTLTNEKKAVAREVSKDLSVPTDLTKLFVFHNLEDITRLARVLDGFYSGENTLFKDDNKHCYYLVIHKSNSTPETFNKLCNILSEYARQKNVTPATEAYMFEHHPVICKVQALQTFAQL
ncbi:MAG: adaptor protein MecA [Roseburia sp.]|nr:adaptor protein MecA [Roseburia sp.]